MTAGIHGLIAVLMQHGQGQRWVHLDCRMPTAAFWQTADVSVAHTPPGREAWRLISQGAQDTSAFRSGVTAFHFRAPLLAAASRSIGTETLIPTTSVCSSVTTIFLLAVGMDTPPGAFPLR